MDLESLADRKTVLENMFDKLDRLGDQSNLDLENIENIDGLEKREKIEKEGKESLKKAGSLEDKKKIMRALKFISDKLNKSLDSIEQLYDKEQTIIEEYQDRYNVNSKKYKLIDDKGNINNKLLYGTDEIKNKEIKNIPQDLSNLIKKNKDIFKNLDCKHSEECKEKVKDQNSLVVVGRQKDKGRFILAFYKENNLEFKSFTSPGETTNNKKTPEGIYKINRAKKDKQSKSYGRVPMPYALWMGYEGHYIHGGSTTGKGESHGCIRLPYIKARELYQMIDVSKEKDKNINVIFTNESIF